MPRFPITSWTAPPSDRPLIVMFASAGREASDFNELATTLNAQGYPIILIEAPGIGRSVASSAAPDLFDLARDAHGVYAARGPVVFLGHAFGNRVARTSASLYDDQTAGVILIASGGQKPIADKAAKALKQCFDPRLTIGQRTTAIRYGFFRRQQRNPRITGCVAGMPKPAACKARRPGRPRPKPGWLAAPRRCLSLPGCKTQSRRRKIRSTCSSAHIQAASPGYVWTGPGMPCYQRKPDEIAQAVLTWLATDTRKDSPE